MMEAVLETYDVAKMVPKELARPVETTSVCDQEVYNQGGLTIGIGRMPRSGLSSS